MFTGLFGDAYGQMLFLDAAKHYLIHLMPARARYYRPRRIMLRRRFKHQCPDVRLTIDGNPIVGLH